MTKLIHRFIAILLSLAIIVDPAMAGAMDRPSQDFSINTSLSVFEDTYAREAIVSPGSSNYIASFSHTTTSKIDRDAAARRPLLTRRQRVIIALALTLTQPFAALAQHRHPTKPKTHQGGSKEIKGKRKTPNHYPNTCDR